MPPKVQSSGRKKKRRRHKKRIRSRRNLQKQFYSGKKKRHTQKTQIAIDANTKRVLATFFGPGRTHDFRLWKQSLFRVAPTKELRVDTGYQGIQKIHSNTVIPKKRRRNQPLSLEEKRANREKAKQRMRVEQVIGHLKRFRLMAEKYRNRRKRFALRVNLIAAWYNLDLC